MLRIGGDHQHGLGRDLDLKATSTWQSAPNSYALVGFALSHGLPTGFPLDIVVEQIGSWFEATFVVGD
jgi:galactose mutarotase-like enzyme